MGVRGRGWFSGHWVGVSWLLLLEKNAPEGNVAVSAAQKSLRREWGVADCSKPHTDPTHLVREISLLLCSTSTSDLSSRQPALRIRNYPKLPP